MKVLRAVLRGVNINQFKSGRPYIKLYSPHYGIMFFTSFAFNNGFKFLKKFKNKMDINDIIINESDITGKSK